MIYIFYSADVTFKREIYVLQFPGISLLDDDMAEAGFIFEMMISPFDIICFCDAFSSNEASLI